MTRHRSFRMLALLLATALVVAACGEDATEDPTPAETTATPPATEAPPATDPPDEEPPDEEPPGEPGLECEEPRVLSYATSLGTDSAYYAGAVALKDAVEELSNGCLEIEIFPDAQLGTDRDMIEGMQLGSIDMASPSTGAMGSVVPEATVLDLPYLFDDHAHVYCVLDGPIGSEDIAGMFEGVGFTPLGYWEIGFRNLTNNVRPVTTPDEVAGLRLRTLPSNVHQTAWSLAGAQPVAMDFTELYNALETGVVDGQENPFNIILIGSLHEVQDYLSVTRHVYGTAPTSISDITWDSLEPALQDVVREAVAISVDAQREAASGDEAAQLQELIDLGMEVVEEPDRESFREAMEPSWSDYTDEFPENQDVIDRIRAAAEDC